MFTFDISILGMYYKNKHLGFFKADVELCKNIQLGRDIRY